MDFFVTSNIINLRKNYNNNISLNENFYLISRFKVVKFSSFETPSPNFPAPYSHISLRLNNLIIRMILDVFVTCNIIKLKSSKFIIISIN
jgi:hypothetical protein